MSVISEFLKRHRAQRQPAQASPDTATLPGETLAPNTERGSRTTHENQIKYLYRKMWVDPELRSAILDIRYMDRIDGRVKKIHRRTASSAVKGGLILETSSANTRLIRAWNAFERRLHLNRLEKLKSDARGLFMEGNLPLQWVLGPDKRVSACIRMPSETILPKVGGTGRFENPQTAYEQYDLASGRVIATFPLWQLSLVRLTPDNYDDQGAMGRPYLDATRAVWKKLCMTEEDLVVRRRTRAPLRLAHILKGMTTEDVEKYEAKINEDKTDITTDFFISGDGRVDPVQGDASLDQIADVSYLLDTFFSGAPAPKGLFGYTEGLNRDILQDLKNDYFEEIDALQDTQAYVYELGFRLDLLLQGLNPERVEFTVKFAERRTDTPNQRADRALKLQALGASRETVWRAAGLNPSAELKQREAEQKSNDPYPDPGNVGSGNPRVNVTPGNAPRGQSSTTISTRN